ncbi:MAG: hypothetical protein AAGA21_11755 [Pseudomonadota bacterium]
MRNRILQRHRWISSLGEQIQAFQIPTFAETMRARATQMAKGGRRQFQRIKWRSPLLLGFALSLVYWLGLFGWMIADVNFKAFRYAGF